MSQQQERSVEARLERLERWRESQAEKFEAVQEQMAELDQKLQREIVHDDQLREQVRALRADVESLGGLADEQATTPDARARDLAIALRRRAEASDDGRVKMTYSEVMSALEDLNHGNLYPQQAYDAMDDAAESVTGVTVGTVNGDTAVRMDIDGHNGVVSINDV